MAHLQFILLNRISASKLFFIEFSTFAEMCELFDPFYSFFLMMVLCVSEMRSSSGEMEPLVESDSMRGHSFSSSVSAFWGGQLASYLKNLAISSRS
jgi:hypothetical protein